MNAFKELRAKQKARDHIKGSSGAMRLDTHRPCLVDLEACPCDENQGRGQCEYHKRTESKSPILVVIGVVVAVFAALAAIHFGAQR